MSNGDRTPYWDKTCPFGCCTSFNCKPSKVKRLRRQRIRLQHKREGLALIREAQDP